MFHDTHTRRSTATNVSQFKSLTVTEISLSNRNSTENETTYINQKYENKPNKIKIKSTK